MRYRAASLSPGLKRWSRLALGGMSSTLVIARKTPWNDALVGPVLSNGANCDFSVRAARSATLPVVGRSGARHLDRHVPDLAGRRFDQAVKLDALAAVVHPGATRVIPVEAPGAVAERHPELPGRRLWRQHQALLLEKRDRQRPLPDRHLGDVRVDLLEGAIHPRVRVVQQVSITLLVHGHGVFPYCGTAICAKMPSRSRSRTAAQASEACRLACRPQAPP